MNGEPGGGETAFLAEGRRTPRPCAATSATSRSSCSGRRTSASPRSSCSRRTASASCSSRSGNNPNAYAADRGQRLPELAGLPNTVAGWGLAFLQLRKSVGASNAMLGIHISAGPAARTSRTTSSPIRSRPRWTRFTTFLAPFGLASNVTGANTTCWSGDPLDRDADYYRLVRAQNRWWDASDGASINSQELQPLRRVAAPVEREGEQTLGAVADPARQLQPPERLQQRRRAPGLQGQPPRILLRRRHRARGQVRRCRA